MSDPSKTPTEGAITASLRWLWRKLGAPAVVLLVILTAIVLVSMGWKELQIGGLLGRLLGRKKETLEPIGVANTVPPTRVGPDGKIIPQGQPDQHGHTQAWVVPIEAPNMFSDPATVRFTPPNAQQPIEVRLPVGVKNTQVEQVVVVRPEVVAVTVRDKSGIKAEKVEAMLARFGK